MLPGNVKDDFEDTWDHQALTFDYYEQGYLVWLDGADDFVEPKQNLENRYGIFAQPHVLFSSDNLLAVKNEKIQAELEEQSHNLEHAIAEAKKLESSAVRFFRLGGRLVPFTLDDYVRHPYLNWKGRMAC